ncbi:MAG TPA: hypothetical protein VIJ47_08580, partial [Acidimicrobiales bacterium]
ELADPVTWERFRALRDRVEQARVTDGDGAAALAEIRAVLAPVEAGLWDQADELTSADLRAQVAWARGLWPPVDRALAALAV